MAAPTDRIRRRVEQFLDEADQTAADSDWERVRDRAEDALALDPENPDALSFLAAAQRRLGARAEDPARTEDSGLRTGRDPSVLSTQSSVLL